jgi:hypothetical protein
MKVNEWAMSAGVNAVAAAESASADAKYKNGVLVFTIAKSGLMFEASVGGQKFRFIPLSQQIAGRSGAVVSFPPTR